MDRQPRLFERFILRLHRRFTLIRLLEQAGLGLLFGCAVAVPLTAVLLWRGEPGLTLASTAVAVGAAAGLASGLARRPTRLEAATEADRQLRLADLLSTAWSVRDRTDDSWMHAVLITADAKTASLSPSTVLVNRFGGRAWGGIGLAAALVFALALVPTVTTESRAGSTNSRVAATAPFLPESSQPNAGSTSAGLRHVFGQAEPQDESRRPGGPSTDESSDSQSAPGSDGAPPRPPADGSRTGQGTGASLSKPPPQDEHSTLSGTTGHTPTPGGKTSAGAGDQTTDAQGSDGPSGTAAGAGRANHAVPPWKSDHWPADSREALRQVRDGRIPDAYHDVIRGYFDPNHR